MLNQLGIKEMNLRSMKAIFEKPTISIIFNAESWKAFY